MNSSIHIALIITCQQPKYKLRRVNQLETVNYLKSEGFEVYYLMGNYDDKNETQYKIIPNFDNECPALIVPCEECYENLSIKMFLGYTYFLNRPFVGILKLDDDTQITSSCVPQYIKEMSHTTDYCGLKISQIVSKFDAYHCDRTLNHKYLYTMVGILRNDKLHYYAGYCYWISKKIVSFVRIENLSYIAEDLSIGDIVDKHFKSLVIKTLPPEISTYILGDYTRDNTIAKFNVYPMLAGGLCNRIFQILATLQYALTNNMNCVINVNLNCENDHPPGKDTLNMIARLFPHIKIETTMTLNEHNSIIVKHHESGFKYEDLLYIPNKHIVLHGFFQCDKFINKIDILEHLLIDGFNSSLNISVNSTAVFLHIRLGDYLTYKQHYVALEQYYIKCIHTLLSETPDKHYTIIIFTNELGDRFNDIIDKLPKSIQLSYDVQKPSDMPDKTLYLMSLCKGGAICANSSMSWIGSYLIHQKYLKRMKELKKILEIDNELVLSKILPAPVIFMPSKWMNYNDHTHTKDNVDYVYPHWAIKVDV
jgi:hypothetical protein